MVTPDKRTRAVLIPHGSASRRASLRWRAPHPRLAPFIFGHWIVSADDRCAEENDKRLAAHPCVNLVADADRVAVHGVRRTSALMPISGRPAALGTNFHPGGFSAFTSYPAFRLTDQVVALEVPFGVSATGVASDLVLAADSGPDAYFARLERFLLGCDPRLDGRYAIIRSVDRAMLDDPAGFAMAELARQHHVSLRTLQRIYRDCVGVPPKWVARRYRLHHAIERLTGGESPDLGSLALELGFSDQAHFSRDFAAAVGRPPRDYHGPARARARSESSF